MSQTALPFFTIGHSSRSLEEFLLLLQQAEVTRVVDIRKIPRSRANPSTILKHGSISPAGAVSVALMAPSLPD